MTIIVRGTVEDVEETDLRETVERPVAVEVKTHDDFSLHSESMGCTTSILQSELRIHQGNT